MTYQSTYGRRRDWGRGGSVLDTLFGLNHCSPNPFPGIDNRRIRLVYTKGYYKKRQRLSEAIIEGKP